MARIALIVTVLNEEKTLPQLLSSIEAQTRMPDEVVIVDGGSTDNTQHVLSTWKPSCAYTWFVRKGNRSVGRNAAIQRTTSPYIAITDAGCILDSHWLEYISAPLVRKDTDVVSGYYAPNARTPFEYAAATYMLVMPQSLNKGKTFLPATRSMALTRKAWENAGQFDETLSDNEDYAFARALQKIKARITFEQRAVVLWTPPHTWKQFLKQIYRFAYGDSVAGMFRPKVGFLFLRYFFFTLLARENMSIFFAMLFLYALWARNKNGSYVPFFHSFYLLPIMQIATDGVVMWGTFVGILHRIQKGQR